MFICNMAVLKASIAYFCHILIIGKRLKSPGVREYLFGDIEKQYKIPPQTLELIAYCMHEVVAEVR